MHKLMISISYSWDDAVLPPQTRAPYPDLGPSTPRMAPSPSPSVVRLSLSMRRRSDHRSRTHRPTTSPIHSEGPTRFETGERRSREVRVLSTSPTQPSCESPRDPAARSSRRGVRGGSVAPERGTHANKQSRSRESPPPVLHPDGHGSIRPAAAGRGTSCRRRPAGYSGVLRIRRRWPSTRNSSHSRRAGP
jgi:hypothetical protein